MAIPFLLRGPGPTEGSGGSAPSFRGVRREVGVAAEPSGDISPGNFDNLRPLIIGGGLYGGRIKAPDQGPQARGVPKVPKEAQGDKFLTGIYVFGSRLKGANFPREFPFWIPPKGGKFPTGISLLGCHPTGANSCCHTVTMLPCQHDPVAVLP